MGNGSYASIAYSRSTRRYGAAWGADSLADAERSARANCRASDSEIVVRGKGVWIALAVSAKGPGYAWGLSRSEAESKAMAARPKPRRPGRIAVSLSALSGPEISAAGQEPDVRVSVTA